MPTHPEDTIDSLAAALRNSRPNGHSGFVSTYVSWLSERCQRTDSVDSDGIRRMLRGWAPEYIDRALAFIMNSRGVATAAADTLEILTAEMAAENSLVTTMSAAEQITSFGVDLVLYNEVLQRRILNFQDRHSSFQLRQLMTAFRERQDALPPAPPSDTLWRGIPPEVVIFYREMTLDLR